MKDDLSSLGYHGCRLEVSKATYKKNILQSRTLSVWHTIIVCCSIKQIILCLFLDEKNDDEVSVSGCQLDTGGYSLLKWICNKWLWSSGAFWNKFVMPARHECWRSLLNINSAIDLNCSHSWEFDSLIWGLILLTLGIHIYVIQDYIFQWVSYGKIV